MHTASSRIRTRVSSPLGAHFQAADFGSPAEWAQHVLIHPRLGEAPGKVFLKEVLGLTGMEVSLGALPPSVSIPFLHAHKQNEKLYLVVSGEGELQVDGEILPLKAGSALRVAPGGVRCWRALGTEPMTYLVVQAKAGSLEQHTGEDGIVFGDPVRWSQHQGSMPGPPVLGKTPASRFVKMLPSG